MVLDEVDQIKPAERSTTLYNLDCLENVGIICISNSQQALFELDARVRSRINPYSVAFPAYSHGDLVEILGYRAETVLAASTYSRKDLTRIAEMASGDARVAIRSLQVSAELAENEHLDAICTRSLQEQSRYHPHVLQQPRYSQLGMRGYRLCGTGRIRGTEEGC